MIESKKKPLTILLASPRGFCAGVDRAILIVERAIELYGRPVYVRHEIVHNRHVVESLEAKGAIFVEELDEVPDDRPVVFSAHGVPKAVPAEAGRRNMLFIDATCPLVSKVHREAERHHEAGRTVVLIGHAGHPEVVGTMGQLPAGAVLLVQDMAEAERCKRPIRTTSPTPRRRPCRSTTRSRSWRRCVAASRASRVPRWRTSATPPPTGRRR
jgi:4-hydroxy-3-methylbut-2-enyl diphosphate reductase